MKHAVEKLVHEALKQLAGDAIPADSLPSRVMVERTRDPRHGDFATNVAMTLAKAARTNPRELASAILAALPDSELIAKTEIAGPGFINVTLDERAYHRELASIMEFKDEYGRTTEGRGQSVLVEFVSANPTGPLHVGHGRHAAYGESIANVLQAAGYRVHREYYVNDAGRQMNILAASVWLRYLESSGEEITFPANGYRGDYIAAIAGKLQYSAGKSLLHPAAAVFADLPPDEPDGDKEEHVDALIGRARDLLGEQGFHRVLGVALEEILADIRDDLEDFGVHYDRWFSERSLTEAGAIARALQRLEEHGRLYDREGAVWFRSTDFGDEKDRVVVRENGQTTYFASDIAYHLEKRERGFDLLLDVLGADHHGYVPRVRAGLEAMGEPGDCLEVKLVQFVALYRGEEKAQMSTRSGDFITLRDLRQEVGNDAARFYYVMRSHDQHLDFDLELAKSRTADNPVYYIQYAHARVSSVLRQLAQKGYEWNEEQGLNALDRLSAGHEKGLMTRLSRFPEIIELAAKSRSPHVVAHYLRDLANDFHTYYNAHTFIVENDGLRNARLYLVIATQYVLRSGLRLLGVSAPDTM